MENSEALKVPTLGQTSIPPTGVFAGAGREGQFLPTRGLQATSKHAKRTRTPFGRLRDVSDGAEVSGSNLGKVAALFILRRGDTNPCAEIKVTEICDLGHRRD